MVNVFITQHDNFLVAHVMPTQDKIPSIVRDNIIASFNVSQILLNL